MSAAVIPIADETATAAAWDDYARMARRIEGDISLMWDSEFNKELARRHARWQRLFLASIDTPGNVTPLRGRA